MEEVQLDIEVYKALSLCPVDVLKAAEQLAARDHHTKISWFSQNDIVENTLTRCEMGHYVYSYRHRHDMKIFDCVTIKPAEFALYMKTFVK